LQSLFATAQLGYNEFVYLKDLGSAVADVCVLENGLGLCRTEYR